MPRRPFVSALLAVALLAATALPAHAVSRSDAATTVISTIITGHPEELQIQAFGPQNPIEAGESIEDGITGVSVTAPSVCWFFWIDPFPEVRFAHPTEYVLVDTTLGTVIAHEDGRWWPRIGSADVYRNSDERTLASPDIIYSGPNANDAAPRRGSDLEFHEIPLRPEAPDPSAGKWGLVIVGEDTGANPDFKADRDTANAILTGPLGVPQDNVTTVEFKSKADVCSAIAALPADCPKLYVFVVAHGDHGYFASKDDWIAATELAHKLKERNAKEYCCVLAQCFSGTFLPVLRDSGLTGFHMTSASDTTCHARVRTATKFPWRGELFLHYLAGCMRAGHRGQAAYRCARDSVASYIERRHKDGTYLHDPGPSSSQVFVDTTSGQKTTIEVPAGTGTVCINWKSGDATTCGNATLYCQVVVAPGDTTWKLVKHWNWNLGGSRYFNPFDAPGTTGKYQMVSHSNGYPVCGDITFADDALPASITSPPIYPGYSVGWNDLSNGEFLPPPLPPVLPPFPYLPGGDLHQVPSFIGQQGTQTQTFQVQLPLQPDPVRPWLYVGGDPLLGFDGFTTLQIFVSGIFDPFGIPQLTLPIQVDLFQGLDHATGNTTAFQTLDGFVVNPLFVTELRAEPFSIQLSVPGAGASEGVPGGYFNFDAFSINTTLFAVLDVPGISLMKRDVARLEMVQPSPNPFTSATRITLAIPKDDRLRLAVYDLTGRLVRTIADGRFHAGEHRFEWDGRDGKGNLTPIGAYFLRAETGGQTASRKIVRMQ